MAVGFFGPRIWKIINGNCKIPLTTPIKIVDSFTKGFKGIIGAKKHAMQDQESL